MKTKFVALLLLTAIAFTGFAQKTVSVRNYTVTASGGVVGVSPNQFSELMVLNPQSGSVVMANNYTIQFASDPPIGSHWRVFVRPTFDLDGFSFTVFGQAVTDEQVAAGLFAYDFYQSATGVVVYTQMPADLFAANFINGSALVTASVPLTKLESGTAGNVVIANGSGVPTYTAFTGDVTSNSSGVTAIGAGVIVNADVNASAAIARTKLAAGSASAVVINDGSGVMTSEGVLSQVRGGFGIDVSASVGFFRFTGGGGTEIGPLTDIRDEFVQFNTDATGTYLMYFPFAVTITSVRATVSELIEATDNATITLQDNSGTPMTSGVITLTGGSTTGTAFTATPTTGNVVTAGTVIKLVTAKTTPGGSANVEVLFTRITL